MSALGEAASRIAAWRRDPVLFVRENFRADPDLWQLRALKAAGRTDRRAFRLAMQACAGPGKSAVLAWLGWWALSCFGEKDEHPNGAAISMTSENLRDGLWKELAKWRDRSPFLMAAFEWQKERIFAKDHPATWFLSARAWSKTADQEALGRVLSGLHSKYIFYLIDEGGSIPPPVLRSAEQGLSNCAWGMIATAGNPTDHASLLHFAVADQPDSWEVLSITGDPDDPERSARVDLEWAQDQIKTHGRDNPWVIAFILGRFPPSSINSLLSVDEVRDAMKRKLPPSAYSNVQKRIGIDPARFGDDRTVLFPRQGLRAFNPVEMRNARTDEIAARLVVGKQRFGSEMEMIDSTGGYGAGVEDQCRLAGIDLIPVNFGGNAMDPRYFDRRSEIYWLGSEWVKNGGWLPNIPGLIKEATAATYTFHKGQLRVVEKKQIKKDLGGQSPDLWEALLVTFALPDMPASIEKIVGIGQVQHQGGGGIASDWNPLEERAA